MKFFYAEILLFPHPWATIKEFCITVSAISNKGYHDCVLHTGAIYNTLAFSHWILNNAHRNNRHQDDLELIYSWVANSICDGLATRCKSKVGKTYFHSTHLLLYLGKQSWINHPITAILTALDSSAIICFPGRCSAVRKMWWWRPYFHTWTTNKFSWQECFPPFNRLWLICCPTESVHYIKHILGKVVQETAMHWCFSSIDHLAPVHPRHPKLTIETFVSIIIIF